ncbi:TniQ family protein [Deefgea sp. CFH1-16]|uniref:TniQ family protein n=1 Tax=Deefgea sp. CFH1-16 TaxID=2675457 RepID=UPI0035B2DD47
MFRPRIETKESLAGYFLRLVEQNCLSGASELLQVLRQRDTPPSRPSLLPQFGVYALDVVANVLGRTTEEFELHCRPLDSLTGRTRKVQYLGLKWPLSIFRNKCRAWCPECMASNSIHRADWDLRLVTTCLTHRCHLVERCLDCGQAISWQNSRLDACRCGMRLSQVIALPLDIGDGRWVPDIADDADRLMRTLIFDIIGFPRNIGKL